MTITLSIRSSGSITSSVSKKAKDGDKFSPFSILLIDDISIPREREKIFFKEETTHFKNVSYME